MEKIQSAVTYKLSIEDVQKAVEMYLKSMGEDVNVSFMQAEYTCEGYQTGYHDYRSIFAGLTIKGDTK